MLVKSKMFGNTLIKNIKSCRRNMCVKLDVRNNEDVHKTEEWSKAKPFESLPGPKPIPILGNVWRFFPHIGTFKNMGYNEINNRLHEEYGDIVIQKGLLIKHDIVNLYNPEDFEKVFRQEGIYPIRDSIPSMDYYRLKMRNDLFKDYGGIFVAQGKQWHEARMKINPVVMQPRTIKLYAEPVDRVAQDFVNKLKYFAKKYKDGEMPADFDKEVNKWALESITLMVLEKRLGLLSTDTPADPEVMEFLEANLNFFDYIFELDFKPSLWKYISTPLWKKYIKALDVLTFFIKNQLDKALQKINRETLVSKSEYELSILERLLKRDESLIFGTIQDLLFGGVDTTSRIIHAWMYYVATNPEVQKKLQEEAKIVLPDLDTIVTQEKIEKMPYLKATLKEILRIAPISIGMGRTITEDVVLSGYQIPKGTYVLTCNLVCVLKDEFYPEAQKFKPERWINDDGLREKRYHPWINIPFGFGTRACLGKRLAMLELEILTAKMARNLNLEWHHKPMRFSSKMMYGIADPLRITIKPIES